MHGSTKEQEPHACPLATSTALTRHSPLPSPLPVAAPVCCFPSPQVLTTYKYKVKVVPGTLKKGKAVRQVSARWLTPAQGGSCSGKSKVQGEGWGGGPTCAPRAGLLAPLASRVRLAIQALLFRFQASELLLKSGEVTQRERDLIRCAEH